MIGAAAVACAEHGLPSDGANQVFAIAPRTGLPELIPSGPMVGLHPGAMNLNADGTVLLAATRQGGLFVSGEELVAEPASLCCFRVGSNGRLTLISRKQMPFDGRGWARTKQANDEVNARELAVKAQG